MRRVLQVIAFALAIAAGVQTLHSAMNGTLVKSAYADMGSEPGGV